MNEEKSKIFLSYAREDIDMAKRIYQDLKRYGLDVWIDCEEILPGQNWKIITEKNIRQSQYFLLLLSSNSVTKRGFVQKEMKIAYEMLEQCSEEDIYMIPVRINDCEPSLKISDIHYIDVFPDAEYQRGLKKILQVVYKEALLLRSRPMELSNTKVNEMLLKYSFYDKRRNPEGKGIDHQYNIKEINGDKVIFDKTTGLMWQQSGSEDLMSYEDAKNLIKEINRNGFAGFSDWKMPTLEEAMSLMEPEEKKDLHIDHIFNSEQEWIWTEDQVKGESRVWVVDFLFGTCCRGPFISDICVRAVRFGQSLTE